MRWRVNDALIAALVLSAPALAGEVIDLRVGYWAVVYTLPDGSQQKEFSCYTPEGLEEMRFFMSTDEECSIHSGTQARNKWEADAVCGVDEERINMHVVLQAPEPTGYTAVVRYEAEAKPSVTVNVTGQWLQESCDQSEIPIS